MADGTIAEIPVTPGKGDGSGIPVIQNSTAESAQQMPPAENDPFVVTPEDIDPAAIQARQDLPADVMYDQDRERLVALLTETNPNAAKEIGPLREAGDVVDDEDGLPTNSGYGMSTRGELRINGKVMPSTPSK